MSKVALLVLAVGLLVLAAAGCGGTVPHGAIAIVGGAPISTAQFEQYIRQLEGESGQLSARARLERLQTADRQAVSALVQQQVLLNAAVGLKITVTPQQVQAQLEQMAAGYGGMQKLYAAAQRAGMNSAQLTTYIKDSLLGQAVYQQMSAKFAPTTALMVSYYKTHKAQFARRPLAPCAIFW